MSDLQKQVETPPVRVDLPKLKKKIDSLQMLYVVLFMTSLVILVVGWRSAMPMYGHVAWAISLGGAVITRITRQSLVAKYNTALLGGGPAPLS